MAQLVNKQQSQPDGPWNDFKKVGGDWQNAPVVSAPVDGPWNDFQKPNRFAKYKDAPHVNKFAKYSPSAQSADGVQQQFPAGAGGADMPTLERAFMKADAAGDTASAQVLATEIKRRRGSGVRAQQSQAQANLDVAVPPYTPITSIPGNAYDIASSFAKGAYNQATHLGDTIETPLGPVPLGFMGPAVHDFKSLYNAGSSVAADPYGTANAIKQSATDNFGTPTRAWNTVATHPVDAAMMLAPGLGMLGKGAEAAGMVDAAGALSKAYEFTNPISLAGKVIPPVAKFVGRIAAYPLAATTGAPAEAINLAAASGLDGGTAASAFSGNLRGSIPAETVVKDARTAIKNIANQRSKAYESGMSATAASSAQVDTMPVRQALNDLRQSLQVQSPPTAGGNATTFAPLQKGSATDFKTLDTIDTWLKDWENHPDGRTPAGMDALKQKLNELQPAFGNPALDNQRRLVTAMQNTIKSQISATEPTYSKTMADYSASKTGQTEIQKTLGLGRKVGLETSLNKLKGAIGGNRANRSAMIDELQANGAPNLRASLAGQMLNAKSPKGDIAKWIAAAISGSAWWHPTHLAALPLTSPRLVGELAHAAGHTSRWLGNVSNRLNDPRILQALVAARLSGGAQQ